MSTAPDLKAGLTGKIDPRQSAVLWARVTKSTDRKAYVMQFMRAFKMALVAIVFWNGAAQAEYSEPARGTPQRSAMLDAMRAHAIEELGAPVEFLVYDLRVNGSVGFAALKAQRPGGGEIDLYQTPGFEQGTIDPEFMDGTTMQGLMRLSGKTWVAVHWAIGATDVWFAYAPFCRRYNSVIADYCEGVDY